MHNKVPCNLYSTSNWSLKSWMEKKTCETWA